MRRRGQRGDGIAAAHRRRRCGKSQTRSKIVRGQLNRAGTRTVRGLSGQCRRVHGRAECDANRRIGGDVGLIVRRVDRDNRWIGHALADVVTYRAAILRTRRPHRQGWIRRNAVRANVRRAFESVDGRVGVIRRRHHIAQAIAHCGLAITRRLILKYCSGIGIVVPA